MVDQPAERDVLPLAPWAMVDFLFMHWAAKVLIKALQLGETFVAEVAAVPIAVPCCIGGDSSGRLAAAVPLNLEFREDVVAVNFATVLIDLLTVDARCARSRLEVEGHAGKVGEFLWAPRAFDVLAYMNGGLEMLYRIKIITRLEQLGIRHSHLVQVVEVFEGTITSVAEGQAVLRFDVRFESATILEYEGTVITMIPMHIFFMLCTIACSAKLVVAPLALVVVCVGGAVIKMVLVAVWIERTPTATWHGEWKAMCEDLNVSLPMSRYMKQDDIYGGFRVVSISRSTPSTASRAFIGAKTLEVRISGWPSSLVSVYI